MIGCNHDHQPVAIHDALLERGIVDMALDETQLGGAVDHGFRRLRGIADRELDLDLRIGAPERDQPRRQPIAGDGLAGVNAERAALEPAQFGQREFGGGGAREHRARFIEEQPAFRVQFDAAADAVEQRDAVAAFERADGRAHRRLRQAQRFGGTGDVLAFGDRDEDTKLLERHTLKNRRLL